MSNASSLPGKGKKGNSRKKSTINEKAVFVWQALVKKGSKVLVFLNNGVQYEGIFHTWSGKDMSVCLKEARRINPPKHIQARSVPQLIIDGGDVLYISVATVDLTFNDLKSDGFKTDSAISGHSGGIRERELEKWQGEEEFSPKLTLGKQTRWDQFETNQRLFGVDTDFNEEDYTTKLDRSDPSFKEKEVKALKLAREIESATSTNMHIAEERGQIMHNESMDEESRYSSVLGKDANAKSSPQGSKKSHDHKKGNTKSTHQSSPISNPPGISPTWSQVAKKSKNESPSVETPLEKVDGGQRDHKLPPGKSRVSVSSKTSEPPVPAKNVLKVDNSKNSQPARVARPVERQQFREQITNATADRKISQRIIQKEAFKSFSEQINTRLPKIATSNQGDTISKGKPSTEIQKATPLNENMNKYEASVNQQKSIDESDKVSEADSVSTATTATRSKFKLNVDAAEFKPSGDFAPPSVDLGYQKRKGASFPKRNAPNSKNYNRASYENEDSGSYPPPFVYMPAYPGVQGSTYIPGMAPGSPTDPNFMSMVSVVALMYKYASGFVPPPGGMFIPPSGGYPGMMPYQIGPMMVPNWMPYQVDENGNPVDPSYVEGYYGEQVEVDYRKEESAQAEASGNEDIQ